MRGKGRLIRNAGFWKGHTSKTKRYFCKRKGALTVVAAAGLCMSAATLVEPGDANAAGICYTFDTMREDDVFDDDYFHAEESSDEPLPDTELGPEEWFFDASTAHTGEDHLEWIEGKAYESLEHGTCGGGGG